MDMKNVFAAFEGAFLKLAEAQHRLEETMTEPTDQLLSSHMQDPISKGVRINCQF